MTVCCFCVARGGHCALLCGSVAQVTPSEEGVQFRLCAKKAIKWSAAINMSLMTGKMGAGCAQKLAGRLSWAVQMLFHKVGRAMIKPIFAQAKSASGVIGPRLKEALEWWDNVLAHDIAEQRVWEQSERPVCRLFVDAASTPARCAAVLFIDGRILYTDGAPGVSLLAKLQQRGDKQIMSLEIIAIMLALSTFTSELSGRKVVLYSDNTGAEATANKGSAKAFDHNMLQHAIWSHVLTHGIHLWIERVPSKENISDLPSRFEYGLLEELYAVWREPVMADLYLGPS